MECRVTEQLFPGCRCRPPLNEEDLIIIQSATRGGTSRTPAPFRHIEFLFYSPQQCVITSVKFKKNRSVTGSQHSNPLIVSRNASYTVNIPLMTALKGDGLAAFLNDHGDVVKKSQVTLYSKVPALDINTLSQGDPEDFFCKLSIQPVRLQIKKAGDTTISEPLIYSNSQNDNNELVAYFPFNGSIADKRFNVPVSNAGRLLFVTDHPQNNGNRSLFLNGNGAVIVNNHTHLKNYSEGIIIKLWLKVDASNSDDFILVDNTANSFSLRMFKDVSGIYKFRFWLNNSSYRYR